MKKGGNLDDTQVTQNTASSNRVEATASHKRDSSHDNLTGSTLRMNFPDDVSP